jgi:hypothetical protein
MSFWTFLLLLMILGVFVIAQGLKVLNSETKAGELAREFLRSIIQRIKRKEITPPAPTEKEEKIAHL